MSAPKRLKKKLSRKKLEMQLIKSRENEISLTTQLKKVKEEAKEYKQTAIQNAAKVEKCEAEIAQLKRAGEQPEYDVSTSKKSKINGICFLLSVSAALTSPYSTWTTGNLSSILSMVFIVVMAKIPEYVRYFFLCSNKKIHWNIFNAIALALTVVSLITCILVAGGEPLTPNMVFFWGITTFVTCLPDIGKLFCALADAI